jgi:hypothetical protein
MESIRESLKLRWGNFDVMNIKKESGKLINFIETASDEEFEAALKESNFGSLSHVKNGQIDWPLPERKNNGDGSTIRKF